MLAKKEEEPQTSSGLRVSERGTNQTINEIMRPVPIPRDRSLYMKSKTLEPESSDNSSNEQLFKRTVLKSNNLIQTSENSTEIEGSFK